MSQTAELTSYEEATIVASAFKSADAHGVKLTPRDLARTLEWARDTRASDDRSDVDEEIEFTDNDLLITSEGAYNQHDKIEHEVDLFLLDRVLAGSHGVYLQGDSDEDLIIFPLEKVNV